MKALSQLTDAELTEELARLKAGAAKLRELQQVRSEIVEMESRTLAACEDGEVVQRVRREACRVFGVEVADLLSRCRTQRVADCRHAAWWLLRTKSGQSFAALGRAFGRDHGSVMHGVEQAKCRIETEAAFRASVEAVQAACWPEGEKC